MILHILSPLLDKFTLPFIKLMDDNSQLMKGEHKYLFICRSDQVEGGIEGNKSTSFFNGSVEFCHPDDGMIRVLNLMQESEQIIIHGLWREKINDLLVANPELFAKVYWVMFGGDYYLKETFSENHIKVIKNVGFLINGITADIGLVRRMYGAKGKHILSFFYTSNVCKTNKIEKPDSVPLNILLGHSGVKENQHLKYLKYLSLSKVKFNIYCPLSYPDKNSYIEEVINYGKKLFGERFIPLLDFMPPAEYEQFLSEKIDIAICASWRMHGVGTINTLLASGAKVYIDQNATTWAWLNEIGVRLFTLSDFEAALIDNHLIKIDAKLAKENSRVMLEYFSEEKLLDSLNYIWSR